MELMERAEPLRLLTTRFVQASSAEGHCMLLSGEAGIGKTSLVNAFCWEQNDCLLLQGTCDALFTPRPLAPLYDIAFQLGIAMEGQGSEGMDRPRLFARFFQEISIRQEPVILVFEDIHWADEATLDFIKFLARRIVRTHCLFILTYRDNEIDPSHPFQRVLGQIPTGSFSRLPLLPLSKTAVDRLSREKGYNGEDVFTISNGNPFYVKEILASYSPGIPDNIRDSILTVFQGVDAGTKEVWKLLSVLPNGVEVRYLEKLIPNYLQAVDNSLIKKILLIAEGRVFFKHELYRRTVESALSPLEKVTLNKKLLDFFRQSFEEGRGLERIVHHAKNANDSDTVVQYAPLAAGQAASLGAHVEAAKLYLAAIEYYQGTDQELLVRMYEAYAYECYLTNQLKEAIGYTERALSVWTDKRNRTNEGNSLRFLSRLWWFDGNGLQANKYAVEAVQVLEDQPSSRAKALAYSNMSQLKMLEGDVAACQHWGGKAASLANEIGDEEVLCHALNNLGTVKATDPEANEEWIPLLRRSLDLALQNGYQEHAARAYTNLSTAFLSTRQYTLSKPYLDEGIRYCEERSLDSWAAYMTSWLGKFLLETGRWGEARPLAAVFVDNERQTPIIRITALVTLSLLRMRKGDSDPLPLLMEAKAGALITREQQRIAPVLAACFEYEWLIGKTMLLQEEIDTGLQLVTNNWNYYYGSWFLFWLWKSRGQQPVSRDTYPGFRMDNATAAGAAARIWAEKGCPYEQALALYETGNEEKKQALTIMDTLGAAAVAEKWRQEMRAAGIKQIPRGMRQSTRSNIALLTGREIDILHLLKEGLQNKEIASRLFISAKTVDHHISSVLFKLEVNSRAKAVQEALRLGII